MSNEPIRRDFHIAASPEEVFAVVTDYENYPKFFPEFTSVIILDTDGSAKIVEFSASYMGKTVEYTLRIDHKAEQFTNSWTYVGGDLKNSEGGWHIKSDDKGGSDIDYRILVQVKFFVPKMVSDKLIATNIPNMFKQLETEVLRRKAE